MPIDLAVSLGHNSSCVAISSETGNILCGFEEERLTGVKSDSSYPQLSIEQCLKTLYYQKVRNIYISHWFADGRLIKCKYYDPGHMNSLGADKIVSVDKKFTHHDAHNYSALAFAQSSPGFEDGFYSFVIDGFGTQGECVSIYQGTTATAKFAKTRLLHRAFGYNKSLGILYQYATAFLGMKMQQDEYKLLGYEAHISKLGPDVAEVVEQHAHRVTQQYISGIRNPLAIDKDMDPIVNVNALKETKDQIFKMLWAVLEELDIDDSSSQDARIIVAALVQKVVEDVVITLALDYGVKKLICSGGVFMNVKLNMKLSQIVDKLCIMPLAGDQGAALGLYHYNHHNLQWPNHVFWGSRDWSNVEKLEQTPGIKVYTDSFAFQNAIIAELLEYGMVNIVKDNMEYGPRALCDTTTLAIPTPENTRTINKLNDRTTVMPMAPVMTEAMADIYLLPEYKKIHKSLEYMICACVLQPGITSIDGAAHEYTSEWFGMKFKTCRPQIIKDDDVMQFVLEKFSHPLINTSFNYHGVPIVYNVEDIISSHEKQNQNGKINTLVYCGEY